MNDCYLIVNADDFGAASGINQGILEAHLSGIVTSASVMVTGGAVADAVAMSADHPELAVGLHWDVWGEDERDFDLGNADAVRDELCRQLDEFHRLFGRLPTHVDSHKHAHTEQAALPVFLEHVASLDIPVRGDGKVRYVGGFYAQWEWKVTNLEYVSVPTLQRILAEEVPAGWTELGCHPGHPSPGYSAVYLEEREAELATLTDPRIRATLDAAGINLVSFADWPRLRDAG